MKNNQNFEFFFFYSLSVILLGRTTSYVLRGLSFKSSSGPLASCPDFPHGVILTNHVTHLSINGIKELNQHSLLSLKSCGKLWWEDSKRMSTHYFPILQARVTCLELRPSTHKKRKQAYPILTSLIRLMKASLLSFAFLLRHSPFNPSPR